MMIARYYQRGRGVVSKTREGVATTAETADHHKYYQSPNHRIPSASVDVTSRHVLPTSVVATPLHTSSNHRPQPPPVKDRENPISSGNEVYAVRQSSRLRKH